MTGISIKDEYIEGIEKLYKKIPVYKVHTIVKHGLYCKETYNCYRIILGPKGQERNIDFISVEAAESAIDEALKELEQ